MNICTFPVLDHSNQLERPPGAADSAASVCRAMKPEHWNHKSSVVLIFVLY